MLVSHMSRRTAIAVLALLLPAWPAAGDAIIRTQAMTASTIAEFFIDSGTVRAELAIGMRDVKAFRNILPDELYEGLGDGPRPLHERHAEFFQKDLILAADGGKPIPGKVVRMEARRRIRRDRITGEPLANQPADAPVVVFGQQRGQEPFLVLLMPLLRLSGAPLGLEPLGGGLSVG